MALSNAARQRRYCARRKEPDARCLDRWRLCGGRAGAVRRRRMGPTPARRCSGYRPPDCPPPTKPFASAHQASRRRSDRFYETLDDAQWQARRTLCTWLHPLRYLRDYAVSIRNHRHRQGRCRITIHFREDRETNHRRSGSRNGRRSTYNLVRTIRGGKTDDFTGDYCVKTEFDPCWASLVIQEIVRDRMRVNLTIQDGQHRDTQEISTTCNVIRTPRTVGGTSKEFVDIKCEPIDHNRYGRITFVYISTNDKERYWQVTIHGDKIDFIRNLDTVDPGRHRLDAGGAEDAD